MKTTNILLIIALISVFVIGGCAKKPVVLDVLPSSADVSDVAQKQESNMISITIVLNKSIDEQTLESLKAHGLEVESIEDDNTYGKVIFGKIDKDKTENLPEVGKISEGVSEEEYKTEVLTEIAEESGTHWVNSRDFKYMLGSQILADKKKKELGIKGPIIDEDLWEEFDEEEFVPIGAYFNIQAWKNWEECKNETISELGNEVKDVYASSRVFSAFITKSGLEKMQDKECFRSIYRRSVNE